MMQTTPPQIRKELSGHNPRVFVTSSGIATLQARAKGSHAAIWKRAQAGIDQYLTIEPAPAPAQARRAQNDTALGIAALAFGYRITGDAKYLAAARKYMDA